MLVTPHIHGWLYPHIDELRQRGELRVITKKLKFSRSKWKYTGEVDKQNKACGEGKLFYGESTSYEYVGTFFDDKPHGIRK